MPSNNTIIVNAQAYSTWRHKLNTGQIGRWFSEKLFGEFSDRMDVLRGVDEQLRGVALGENVFSLSLKEAIKKAKEAYKDGRYVDAAYYLAAINEITATIILQGQDTADKLRSLGKEYLARSENPESLDFFGGKAVEAQIGQKIYRTLFGDPLERAYRKELAKRKQAVNTMINNADKFVALILSSFDKMGLARASGKIDEWLGAFDKFAQIQPRYQSELNRFFNSHIKDLVEAAQAANKVEELGDNSSLKNLSSLFGVAFKGEAPKASPQQQSSQTLDPGDIIDESYVEPEVDTEYEFDEPDVTYEEDASERGRPIGSVTKNKVVTPDGEEIETKMDIDRVKTLFAELSTEEKKKDVAYAIALVQEGVTNESVQDDKGNILFDITSNSILFNDDGKPYEIPFTIVEQIRQSPELFRMLQPYKEEVKKEEVAPAALGPAVKKKRSRKKSDESDFERINKLYAPILETPVEEVEEPVDESTFRYEDGKDPSELEPESLTEKELRALAPSLTPANLKGLKEHLTESEIAILEDEYNKIQEEKNKDKKPRGRPSAKQKETAIPEAITPAEVVEDEVSVPAEVVEPRVDPVVPKPVVKKEPAVYKEPEVKPATTAPKEALRERLKDLDPKVIESLVMRAKKDSRFNLSDDQINDFLTMSPEDQYTAISRVSLEMPYDDLMHSREDAFPDEPFIPVADEPAKVDEVVVPEAAPIEESVVEEEPIEDFESELSNFESDMPDFEEEDEDEEDELEDSVDEEVVEKGDIKLDPEVAVSEYDGQKAIVDTNMLKDTIKGASTDPEEADVIVLIYKKQTMFYGESQKIAAEKALENIFEGRRVYFYGTGDERQFKRDFANWETEQKIVSVMGWPDGLITFDKAIPVAKSAHSKFVKELNKLATKNDPYLLALAILNYSAKIEDTDFETSTKLLNKAMDIINGK